MRRSGAVATSGMWLRWKLVPTVRVLIESGDDHVGLLERFRPSDPNAAHACPACRLDPGGCIFKHHALCRCDAQLICRAHKDFRIRFGVLHARAVDDHIEQRGDVQSFDAARRVRLRSAPPRS